MIVLFLNCFFKRIGFLERLDFYRFLKFFIFKVGRVWEVGLDNNFMFKEGKSEE